MLLSYMYITVKTNVPKGTLLLLIVFISLIPWVLFGYHLNTPSFIAFLDVGQGDAALIQPSHGIQVMIDVGPGIEVLYELEKYMPLLDRHIEGIFLSHGHIDHVGGLEYIAKRYTVGKIFVSECFDGELLEYVGGVGEMAAISAGNSVSFGDMISVAMLWPGKQVCEDTFYDENDVSQILEVTAGDFKMLFTGDAEFGKDSTVEYTIGFPDIDVLKVPHHGSKNAITQEFLDKTSPLSAIISVGENPFGHPGEDILSLLQNNNIEVLRTDLHGAIVFERHNDGYRVHTELE